MTPGDLLQVEQVGPDGVIFHNLGVGQYRVCQGCFPHLLAMSRDHRLWPFYVSGYYVDIARNEIVVSFYEPEHLDP